MASTDEATSDSIGAKLKAFRYSIWNPEKKQFVGRDGMSWAKIGLFYFVFYACLAGFFAVMLAIFMQIIDRRIPTYTLDRSVLANKGVNPGMGYRPQPNVERNLIKYKQSQMAGEEGWGLYRNTLRRYLQDFDVEDTVKGSEYIDCSTGQYVDHASRMEAFNNGKSCIFNLRSFGGAEMPCVDTQEYLYDRAQPCVVVKLNRIYNWEPVAYNNRDEVPDDIKPYWNETRKDFIYVTCRGENPADHDNLHDIAYFSPLSSITNDTRVGGYPFYYYPFRNQVGYRQPLVFVHFRNVEKNVLINIECRAWARNVEYDRTYQRGSVHFELMID